MMLAKLKEAAEQLEEAAARMPQDIAWQRMQNARVALGSVIDDLEAANVAPMVTVSADPVPVDPVAVSADPVSADPDGYRTPQVYPLPVL